MAPEVRLEHLLGTRPRAVFLLSGKRAGSTMVGRILDSHSQIAAPFELAIPFLLGRGHWKHGAAVQKSRVIASRYGLQTDSLVPSRFFGSRKRETRKLNRVVEAVLREEGKEIFVVKEPAHLDVAEKILSIFGHDSVFVLLRGPLASSSSLHRTFRDPQALETWKNAYRIVPRLLANGVFSVRFEHILEKPREAIASICVFLGVAFEESMLDFGSFSHADDDLPLWHRSAGDPILVPTGASGLHRTVAKGRIQPEHNDLCLARVPEHIFEAYSRDVNGVRTLGEQLGYYEIEDIGKLRAALDSGERLPVDLDVDAERGIAE